MSDNKVNTNNPPEAVKSLAEMIKSEDGETQRAGKRQLWQMVRHVGRPGNSAQQQALVTALLGLITSDQPAAVKREAIWAASELGGDECVSPVAVLLANNELREDACRVLERLPGQTSLDTLRAAMRAASEEFRPSIAQALRARGVAVDSPPCRKLEPSRRTEVKPVGRA
jgi:hypothetical protein